MLPSKFSFPKADKRWNGCAIDIYHYIKVVLLSIETGVVDDPSVPSYRILI